MNPRFYFATCQVGAEKAVKAEVAAEHPSLRFAFSRPGFITFKEDPNAGEVLPLQRAIFTRLWGEIVGQAKDRAALGELMTYVPPGSVIHAFERDQFVPGDEPKDYVRDEHLHAILGEQLNGKSQPKIGDTVYDLIWVDDFHVFLGRHEHTAALVPEPGNIPRIPLPEESPSRAFLKIEEAFLRFHPIIRKGWQVLEVGCSPGGATTAMLNRGLQVTGVDPKFMDERLRGSDGFKFIQKTADRVVAEDLRSVNPDWLVMDMNIAPLEALDQLGHIVGLLRRNFRDGLKLHHGFLTVKLNDWKFAESICLYLRRLEEMGFGDLRATQLCSNRQEFFVYAGKFAVSGRL